MALEDFTTFTEVDPVAYITVVGANQADANSMPRTVIAYLYKDYGVGHFDDFEHLHEVEVVSPVVNNAYVIIWGVANAIDDASGWDAGGDGVCIYARGGVGNVPRLMLFQYAGGQTLDDSIDLIDDTRYYLTTKKDGVGMTCKIYSDAARTVLVDTLTLAVNTQAYRYLYAICSLNDAVSAVVINTESHDFDLQEIDTHNPVDDANATDAVTFNAGENLTDDANASDAVTFEADINLDDTAKASDSVSFNVQPATIEDNAKASDNVSFQMFHAHLVEDTAKASDAITFEAEINLADIAKASDLYSDNSPPPPVVRYPCSTFTLYGTSTNILFPKPEWANPNNSISKNVSLFNFKSGDLDTVDRGINAQPLTIGGTVFIYAGVDNWCDNAAMTIWLNSIKNAMNNGETFTINEFGDCLNGVYVIGNFTFNTMKGVPDAFSWSLNLERVIDT